MARHLGSEQPFYGFQSQGLDEERAPDIDVETMATHYVEQLLEAQPDEPYLLGGYSMGGVVAFEMAQQLHARGKRVSMLAMLDTTAPNPAQKFEAKDNETLMVSFARELGLSVERLALSSDYLLKLDPDQRLLYVLEEAKKQGLMPADIGDKQIRRLWRVFETNARAMRNYVPQIYRGRIVLFNAIDNPANSSQDPSKGWNVLAAGGVDIHELPGDHFSIVREHHVRSLAERLADCISKIEEG
jgi:thioesterase domain-containing protein